MLGIALAGMFGASSAPASALASGDYVGEVTNQHGFIWDSQAHLDGDDPIEGTMILHFAGGGPPGSEVSGVPDIVYHLYQTGGSGNKRTVRADVISEPGKYVTWDLTVEGDSFTGYGTGSSGPEKSSCSFQHV